MRNWIFNSALGFAVVSAGFAWTGFASSPDAAQMSLAKQRRRAGHAPAKAQIASKGKQAARFTKVPGAKLSAQINTKANPTSAKYQVSGVVNPLHAYAHPLTFPQVGKHGRYASIGTPDHGISSDGTLKGGAAWVINRYGTDGFAELNGYDSSFHCYGNMLCHEDGTGSGLPEAYQGDSMAQAFLAYEVMTTPSGKKTHQEFADDFENVRDSLRNNLNDYGVDGQLKSSGGLAD